MCEFDCICIKTLQRPTVMQWVREPCLRLELIRAAVTPICPNNPQIICAQRGCSVCICILFSVFVLMNIYLYLYLHTAPLKGQVRGQHTRVCSQGKLPKHLLSWWQCQCQCHKLFVHANILYPSIFRNHHCHPTNLKPRERKWLASLFENCSTSLKQATPSKP